MDARAVVMMSGSELLSAYDDLHDSIAELEARQSQILARLEEIRYAKELGAHDTARMIAARYRLDPAEAHRRVKLAGHLVKYSAVAAALPAPGNTIPADGTVLHMAQAAAIVSALEQIPSSANVPVEELVAAEEQMVQAACEMAPGDLRKLGVQVRNILDTDGPEPREDAARAREDVWVKTADGGVRFGGYLAAENAERLETVLQHGAKPHKTETGERDPRSRGKRQADALSDALNIALGSGDLPGRGGIKPHITVTIDLADLIEAGKTATGDLVFGDGLSAGAIRRLACDAGVIPVVLGSDSQPLDVGREFRFVTPGLRNALNQRDRGCVVCGAPPIYCAAHHLVSWLDGGATSLPNTVLLCRVHHTALHQGHWTIHIIDNQVKLSRPTWTDRPPPAPRRSAPTPHPTGLPTHPATAPCPPPTVASIAASTGASTAASTGASTAASTGASTAASTGASTASTGATAAVPTDASTAVPTDVTAAASADVTAAAFADVTVAADEIASVDVWTVPPDADACTSVAPVDVPDSAVAQWVPLTAGMRPVLARAWPTSDDVTWITQEEAAALDPWSDPADTT